MSGLQGLRVLHCCSTTNSDSIYARRLSEEGCRVTSLPLIKVQYFNEEHVPIFLLIEKMEISDWVIFSSIHGMNAFHRLKEIHTAFNRRQNSLKVGLVGKKAWQAFKLYFPQWDKPLRAGNINQLLRDIAARNPDEQQKVLHLTSRESLALLQIYPPATIDLERLPLYRMVGVDLDEKTQNALSRENFDLLFFNSPSTFYFFREWPFAGKHLQNTAIAVLGERSRHYIEGQGFPVAVSPSSPTPVLFIQALHDARDTITHYKGKA